MTNKRTIVIEELQSGHEWYIRWRCWLGDSVYYLRTSLHVRHCHWLRRLSEARQLQELTFRRPVYFGINAAADRAFDVVERLYAKLFSGIPAVQRLGGLYENKDIHLAFKKVMNEELTDVFYCVLLREGIEEMLPGESLVWFVPREPGMASKYARWTPILTEGDSTDVLPLCLAFPYWLRLAECVRDIFAWARVVGMYAYFPIVCLRRILMFEGRPVRNESLRYAIAIYSPVREFSNTIRGFDFLLDGDRIRKDNTVFVPLLPLTQEHMDVLTHNNFQVAILPVGASTKTLLMYLRQGLPLLSAWLFYPEWISRTYARLLWTYGLWNDFAERHPVKHFISYCDSGAWHIGRNILLRRNGIQTWFYVDTINGPDCFPKSEDELPYRQHIYGFLYYDHFVSWCERHARWNRMLQQRVGCYHDVGCLWSEHTRLVQEGKIPSAFPGRLVQAGYCQDMKMVAVFDSWFYDAGMITSEDLQSFIRDVERLLNEFEDVFLVVKEKKSRWFFQEPYFPRAQSTNVYAAYDQLEKHPRCFFPGPSCNPSEIVAFSNLVIAFPFTSVGFEALGARRPAIYHDAASRHRGAYYDRIPGLLTHGYSELRNAVQLLLYDISIQEYGRFLDTKVKGEAESFLDGRGITRFRELLAKE